MIGLKTMATAAALLLCAATAMAVTYTGNLTTVDGGLTGSRQWNSNSQNIPTTLEWTVDDTTTPGMWHYRYVFTVPVLNHPQTEIKYMDVETSTNFTSSDLSNVVFGPETTLSIDKVGTLRKDSAEPSQLTGIRVIHREAGEETEDGIEGHVFDVAFDSTRSPQWGDFFARGYSSNTIRNAGFTRTDVDPNAAPTDGSLQNHLLVPDTAVVPIDPVDPTTPPDPNGPGVIPEPLTAILLGAALLPLGRAIRRRWRK